MLGNLGEERGSGQDLVPGYLVVIGVGVPVSQTQRSSEVACPSTLVYLMSGERFPF